jgi:aspartyl-tRNA(Asn)/glutamyl-tRNA(Gln) amidotransferase subunit A
VLSGRDYVRAVHRPRELRAQLQQAMAGIDIVLTATQPAEAAKIDAVPKWDLFDNPGLMMPFKLAGCPAISVCAGFGGASGPPMAIQLVGRPFQEPSVLRVADAFEKATPFLGQRPRLVTA